MALFFLFSIFHFFSHLIIVVVVVVIVVVVVVVARSRGKDMVWRIPVRGSIRGIRVIICNLSVWLCLSVVACPPWDIMHCLTISQSLYVAEPFTSEDLSAVYQPP